MRMFVRRILPPTLFCAIHLFVAPVHAQSDDAQRQAQRAETQRKLDAVRAQIAQIAEARRTAAAQRDRITAALADQAKQLNDASNALDETDAAIARKSSELTGLQERQGRLQDKLAGQREALSELLRAAYALNRGGDLSLLLGDEDIERISRALAYSRYFQRDRVQRIRSLLSDLAKLEQLRRRIEADQAALQRQRSERAERANALLQARDEQRELLAQADARLAQQKDQLAALQGQERDLNALLEKLKDLFADIPRQLGGERPFAQLRGDLPWPARGRVRAGGGPLAHGLLIDAAVGTTVRAVAYGRVAWAEFMRGYGMLVIVDHGGGWMSLYGNNEAALVEAGDWVKPGQPVARVGQGESQSGAYFELRKDGKPVDARGWLKSPG
ncbi:MAG TPA: peptidoglycan DD-metalloendopeptidase family protein [Rhodanobacteraceae bacterium]|nr:peptidoglycan DD-metalloendopeptidase family protein [Rhodanobacteraceae bacterium]